MEILKPLVGWKIDNLAFDIFPSCYLIRRTFVQQTNYFFLIRWAIGVLNEILRLPKIQLDIFFICSRLFEN